MKEIAVNRMEELAVDQEFVTKFSEAESYEDAYQLLIENGVDCTYEEFREYLDEAETQLREKNLINEDGELSAEMLDMVSGGLPGLVIIGIGVLATYIILKGALHIWKRKQGVSGCKYDPIDGYGKCKKK